MATYSITTFDSDGAPDCVYYNLTLEQAQAEIDMLDPAVEYCFEEETA